MSVCMYTTRMYVYGAFPGWTSTAQCYSSVPPFPKDTRLALHISAGTLLPKVHEAVFAYALCPISYGSNLGLIVSNTVFLMMPLACASPAMIAALLFVTVIALK